MAKAEICTENGFTPGNVSVIGWEPQYAPYVSIRDADERCVAVIDKRAMNALVRAWQRATARRLEG